ncbi:DUF2490 domain-containing protein [Chitinophagaceae bacterium LB-8]|jgi:uncharacterized protein DUF2490|uniref:DUF2490 domain-containing protein n=1 Tax=Paraflavisolibacter caeni TaxID=2982496 RepID=A0A9X2XXW6_9BACT|nr:DUF2490 domain-containing protein [Paraflavisolibacter caeni]MCU7550786.1 DUF2490 domain-containing protein [Paraflavisolibacter caeni]
MKRMPTILFFLIAIAIKLPGFAQKQVSKFEQIWLGYVSNTRISERWGIWFDANIRTRDNFTKGLNVTIIRPGIMYFITDNTNLTFGYAYANYFAGNDGRTIALPEHRPWQQLIWTNRYPKLRLHNRLRLEERFLRKLESPDKLGNGYNFNYRIRYSFSLSTPLSKKAFEPNTVTLVLNDEVMLNFGKKIQTNTFDQNRLFGGLNYHLSKHSILQAGYMYTFQQQGTGAQYRNIHTIRINFLHNPDLRKKERI